MLRLSAGGGEEAWLAGWLAGWLGIPVLLEALRGRMLTLARACSLMLSRMHLEVDVGRGKRWCPIGLGRID